MAWCGPQTISEDLVPFTRDDAGGAAMPSQSRVSSQGAPFTPITDCEQVGWVNTINADTTVTVVGFSLVPGGELLQLRSDTVAGRGFNVYASPTAIYVASGNFNWQQERTVVLVFDLVPGDYGAATKRGPGAAFRGIGSVPGTILSQWSMDEGADGSLRIATHTNQLSMSVRRWVRNGVNNVFVVNATATTGAALSAAGARILPTVGALTGLAPGETIKASRFIGDRLYLVTFVRVGRLQQCVGMCVWGDGAAPNVAAGCRPAVCDRLVQRQPADRVGRVEDPRFQRVCCVE